MAVPEETRLLVVELDRLMGAGCFCICSNMASFPATPLGFLGPPSSLCGSDDPGVVPDDDDDDDLFSSWRIQASRLEVGAAVGGRVLGGRRGIEPAAAPWAVGGAGAAGCHDRRRSSVEDGARVLVVDVGVGMDAFLGVGRAVLVSGMGSRFIAQGKSARGCIAGIEKRFVPSLLPPPPVPPPVTRRPVVLGPTDRNKLVSRTECRWEDSSGVVEDVGGPAGTSLLHDMTVRRRDWMDEVASEVATASTAVEWRSEMRIGCRSAGATDASGINSRRLVVLGLLGATRAADAVVDDEGATDQVSGTTTRGAGAGTGFRATVSSMLASWSVLMENKSAMGVVLHRCAGSGFGFSVPSCRRPLGPFRRVGDGGGGSTFASSNHPPSASRNASTRVRSTSRIGAAVGTPSCPVAVALSFLVDPRRTRLDSFSRTLGSCILLKWLALSQIDGMSR